MNPKPEQPQGIICLNYNTRARNNPSAPFLVGRISTPEAPDKLFPFSLFHNRNAEGQSYFIGPVNPSLSLRGALASTANMAPNTHFLTMRANGFKVFSELDNGKPNPAYAQLTAEQKAIEESKPSFWGSWTRNSDDALLRFSAWDRGQGQYGGLWASGIVQHPLTRAELDALRNGDGQALQQMLQQDVDANRDEPPFPAHPDDEQALA